MFTLNKMHRVLIGTMAAGFLVASHAALDISQTPLLTQTGTVSPNLMLILDDSGSMTAQYIYQYGGTPNGYGYPGPGVTGKKASCPATLTIDTTCTYNLPSVSVGAATTVTAWSATSWDLGDYVTYLGKTWVCTRDPTCGPGRIPGTARAWKESAPPATGTGAFYEVSPNVNRLTYDPRIRYQPRLTGLGATTTTAATPSTADFYVFFYKNSTGNSVDWPGTGNDPANASSYFDPYLSTDQATTTQSILATGATLLSYPKCVGSGTSCTIGPFPKFFKREECSGNSCSLAEERQNYANWKKFYSNRIDMTKTGLGYAFRDISSGLRLGWTTINNRTSTSLGAKGSGVGKLDQTRKTAFYTWLYSMDVSGSTPLRSALTSAGEYFTRADDKGPWADAPDPTSVGLSTLAIGGTDTQAKRQAHASCRRSYTMMLTDGYYNDNAPTFVDTDATAITTSIAGETSTGSALTFNYNGTTKPYAAVSTFTTMADIAMKYWITDLRPAGSGSSDFGLKNNVAKSNSNESFWQNMGFYAVGLGIDGTLTQNTATLNNLTTGTTTWPEPPSDGDGTETIDDLWHATVNGRGRMLSARSADALADGVEGMLAEINTVEASQSGVAASTLSLTTSTKKYTPNYTTGTWVGNVIASDLEAKSGAELCTRWRVSGSWLTDPLDSTKKHWYVNGKYDGTPDLPPCVGSPTTFNGIPAHTSRNIYAWNDISFGDFNSSNPYVMSATTGVASEKLTAGDANLVNYLRGDKSREDVIDSNGNIVTTNSYRARPFLLGDIVNSTPTFIKGALNMSYDRLPAGTYGQSAYNTFVATKAARTEGVLFAGANDGMLHGFRETTGAEVFAFVPRAVMPKMHQLASRSYNHLYFVDGTTAEADACFGGSTCTTWTNLLLGTAGGGGKTVFALDVTSPMTMTASSIKWEITPQTVVSGSYPFANLGNILTDVQTGLSMDGTWVAIFGNGYNGGAGTEASLFVVDLDTGALIREIVVRNTIPVSGGNNGLGGVRLLRDSNQRIIAAYAGDLKGNLWKFDLSSTTAGSWAVALGNTPLYKTADTSSPAKQPIMATPAVVPHPLNGYVVAFGTGKLFESADVSSTVQQSVYGVWDSVTPPAITQIDRTSLVAQTITTAIAGTTVITNSDLSTSTVALNYYSISKNPVNWTTATGWYIDLNNTGQRTIYPIEVLAGTYAAVDTVSPTNSVVTPCLASGSGKAWNYVMNLVTGAGPTESIFDNNGGIVTTNVVSGYENTADGRTKYIKNDALSTPTSTGFTPLSTQQLPSFNLSCVLTNSCASTVGNSNSSVIKRRTWRQVFLR